MTSLSPALLPHQIRLRISSSIGVVYQVSAEQAAGIRDRTIHHTAYATQLEVNRAFLLQQQQCVRSMESRDHKVNADVQPVPAKHPYQNPSRPVQACHVTGSSLCTQPSQSTSGCKACIGVPQSSSSACAKRTFISTVHPPGCHYPNRANNCVL